MHHADFADKEKKPLYIYLADTKRSNNLRQPQIRMKNPKSGDNPDLELLSGSGVKRIVTGNPRIKNVLDQQNIFWKVQLHILPQFHNTRPIHYPITVQYNSNLHKILLKVKFLNFAQMRIGHICYLLFQVICLCSHLFSKPLLHCIFYS